MIPLELTSMFLPRMNINDALGGHFPLNIVKAPIVHRVVGHANSSPGVIRMLQSRNQPRKSSALSMRTLRIKEHNSCEKSGVKSASENQLLRSSYTSVRVNHQETRREKIISLSARSAGISKLNDAEVISDSTQEITASASDPFLYYLMTTNDENCMKETRNLESNSHDHQIEHPDVDPDVNCDDSMVLCGNSKPQINKGEQARKSQKLKHKKMWNRRKKLNTVKKKKGNFSNNLKQSNLHKKGLEVKSLWCSSKQLVITANSSGPPIKCPTSDILNMEQVDNSNAVKESNLLCLPKVCHPATRNCNEMLSLHKQTSNCNLSNGINTSNNSVRGHFVYKKEKLKKVYLSSAQSKILMSGVPSAPPSTPTQEQLKLVQYIPSLSDIKSQRAVRSRLIEIEHKMKMNERKKKEKVLKAEQKKASEVVQQLKEQQRIEIYALNKIMTELENRNFEKFMQDHQAVSLPV